MWRHWNYAFLCACSSAHIALTRVDNHRPFTLINETLSFCHQQARHLTSQCACFSASTFRWCVICEFLFGMCPMCAYANIWYVWFGPANRWCLSRRANVCTAHTVEQLVGRSTFNYTYLTTTTITTFIRTYKQTNCKYKYNANDWHTHTTMSWPSSQNKRHRMVNYLL